jgi:CheY-like chemotaxis protein
MNICEHQPTTTSILLIDGSKKQRTYWANQLRSCSADYEILEASDGQSGLDLYRSRRIDCVVLDLVLPDQSGFPTLVELVPIANKPEIAVIVLTMRAPRGVRDLAKESGAYECFAKQDTSGEDLDRAIQHAVFLVRQINKKERYRPSFVHQTPVL